ncbi:MAG: extracellular solute-binding protein [Candidatus Pacebacteria bacterium]|nr:extracellular solute-binding protein [Candidatus Paceibacterota bacterium]
MTAKKTSRNQPLRSSTISPLVEQVIGAIRKDYIETGTLSALPSERQVSTEQGVSRRTVRKALDVIEERGWVHKDPGGKTRYIHRENDTRDAPAFLSPIQMPHAFADMTSTEKVPIRLISNDVSRSVKVDSVWNTWAEWIKRIENNNSMLTIDLSPWPITGSIPHGQFPPFDILQASSHNHSLYRPQGGLLSIDSFIEDEGIDNVDFIHPLLWKDAKRDGRILGLPFGATVPCLAVSKDLWRKVSNRTDFLSWTWDECLDVLENIHCITQKPPLTMTNVSILLNSLGFDVYSPSDKLDSAKTAEILTRLCRLTDISDVRYICEPVAVGKVPASTILSCSIPNLMEINSESLSFVPHPCEREGWFHRYVSLLFLSNTSPCIDYCWEISRMLCGLSIQREVEKNGNLIPANTQAWPAPNTGDTPLNSRRFLLDTLHKSRSLHLNDFEMLEVESNILGPEYRVWLRKGRVSTTDLKRLNERLSIFYASKRNNHREAAPVALRIS